MGDLVWAGQARVWGSGFRVVKWRKEPLPDSLFYMPSFFLFELHETFAPMRFGHLLGRGTVLSFVLYLTTASVMRAHGIKR